MYNDEIPDVGFQLRVFKIQKLKLKPAADVSVRRYVYSFQMM